jgi:hypothetical protein
MGYSSIDQAVNTLREKNVQVDKKSRTIYVDRILATKESIAVIYLVSKHKFDVDTRPRYNKSEQKQLVTSTKNS